MYLYTITTVNTRINSGHALGRKTRQGKYETLARLIHGINVAGEYPKSEDRADHLRTNYLREWRQVNEKPGTCILISHSWNITDPD